MAIKTGIIGFGRSGETLHGDTIAQIPDYRITAIADADEKRLAVGKTKFSCAVYQDYQEMLKKEDLDLAVIVSRSDQHCPMTCDCLKAKVPALVTKPWCVNEAEARKMIDLEQSTGVTIYPWLPSIWGTDTARLKEIVVDGTIGKVFCIRRSVATFGVRNDWQMWKQYGGGYVLNWGPHLVDPPIHVLGSPAVSVYAKTRLVINPGDTEDIFFAVITLANGATVHAEYTIAVTSPAGWFVQGDRGTVVVNGTDLAINRAEIAAPADPTQTYSMQAKSEVVQETLGPATYGDASVIYRDLAQAIQGGKAFRVDSAHALRLTRVLDAIKLSSAENRVVSLG